eukprot:GHVU01036707.1.p1 GENE.GHVU01036707.1~~GHVU01036707.1.p1  ORF type:complete len:152 (+),score=14.38 GHVU01036707.1:403-858(+)
MAQMRTTMGDQMNGVIESLTSLVNNGGSSVDQYIKLPLLPLDEVPKDEKDREIFLFETIPVPGYTYHPYMKSAITTLISQLKNCVTQLTLHKKTLYAIRNDMLLSLTTFRKSLPPPEAGSSVEERGRGAELPTEEGPGVLTAVDFGNESYV